MRHFAPLLPSTLHQYLLPFGPIPDLLGRQIEIIPIAVVLVAVVVLDRAIAAETLTPILLSALLLLRIDGVLGLGGSLVGVRGERSLTQPRLRQTHRVRSLPHTAVPAATVVAPLIIILSLIVCAQLGAEGETLLLTNPLLLHSDLLRDAQLGQIYLEHVRLGRLENFSRAVHKDTAVPVGNATDLTLA